MICVHCPPDCEGDFHIIRHVEGFHAAAGAGSGGVADDSCPVLDSHVVAEELAGAVATGVDQNGDLAIVTQVLGRQDEVVLRVGVEEEVFRVLVIEAGVAQHMRLIEEVGRHLLGQPAAAAAVAAHVDDEAGHGVVIEFVNQPFPEVNRQAFVVAE